MIRTIEISQDYESTQCDELNMQNRRSVDPISGAYPDAQNEPYSKAEMSSPAESSTDEAA